MSHPARSAPVASCLFCDDVREEIGSKFSLMGIYGDDLVVVGRPPILLPKLVLVVWVITDIGDPLPGFAVRVRVPPGRRELINLDVGAPAVRAQREGATRMHAQAIIPITPFPLDAIGDIEVEVDLGGESQRAGRLAIKFADKPPGA